ncbi:uncharacterized protein LOC126844933 isoform X2 [Adelges cooleyi]|uniref:uncharacterized protein LOC126844933 isoform X2 n=1 Tax=Adelges cooleyi TaxID=133065 RepID=UPI00217F8F4A|nr:uncharacterized protein LOC126844933 isoform X2 [Adelges cooleyi]
MTEVTTRNVDYGTSATAIIDDSDKKVLSVRRYEAKPPENLDLVDPDNLIATTKEEEWVTKKKVELTTKKQIETRVKRQVVLEDGKVVEDSGPIVTTNTTEDTEKQEHQQTEHRQIGDEGDGDGSTKEVVVRASSLEGNPSLLKEVREKKIKSREEKEELVETEDVVHLGNISDKAYQEAVQSKKDIRQALEESNHKLVHVNSTGPRVTHQSSKNKKVTDTEDTRHTREVQKDGKIVTETSKTTEHEEVNGVDEPDSVPLPTSALQDSVRESSHRYVKTKDQDLIEYLADGEKIGEKMRYEAINEEGGRSGDVDQQLMLNDTSGWESLSERIRRMRDRQQQQPAVAGKTLADFDEEERTRKVETAKWLEHHFGSESTRSSTGNLSEEEEDDRAQRTTSNSFINVTMKSTDAPPVNGYFKGVSEWKAKDPAPVVRPARRKKEQRAAEVNESAVNELESLPLFNTVQKRVQGYEMSKEKLSARNSSSNGYSQSHHHNGGYVQTDRSSERRSKTPESPDAYRSWDRRRRSSDKIVAPEPQPDYSPEPERRASNGSAGRAKKVYQKTRFATEAGPPASGQQRLAQQPGKQDRKKSFGESFRRLVSKFTGNKDAADRKKNRKKTVALAAGEPVPSNGGEYGYSDGYSDDDHHDDAYRSYDDGRASADRHQRLFGSTQTLDRHRNGRTAANKRDVSCEPSPSRAMNGITSNGNGVQRYYLGEDPFGGSIYGREKEYDGVTTYKRKHQKKSNGVPNGHEQSRSTYYVQRTIPVNTSSTTLGRLSKSTGRLLSDDYSTGTTDRSQTLPRKLRTESKIKKQVYNSSRENDYNGLNRPSATNTGGSMINVSFANGPAKPLRTFSKPSLLRSQSFNVQPADPGQFSRRSVSTLHRLEESPPPLKSPNIVSSISRSTKDLQSVGVDDGYRSLSGSWASPGELSNGGGSYRPRGDDPKKKIFMKGLMDHAPELYKTLNNQDDRAQQRYSPARTVDRPYSSSGHSSSPITVSHRSSNGGEVTNRSVTRRGSKDDYSETVRITSKSDDPYRPSVTNTVQNFSKKTVPRDGRVETIESSETKTVTKSRYNGGDPVAGKINGFSNNNGGVVIEVRNGRN